MAEYAKVPVGGSTIQEFRDWITAPPDMTRKGFKWLPVVVVDPAWDASLQKRSGPVLSVIVDMQVNRTWTVVDKTAQEIDDERVAKIDDRLVSPVDKALGLALFNVINDVRVLKGQGTITLAQFKTALKALM